MSTRIAKLAVLDSGLDKEYKAVHWKAYKGDCGALEGFYTKYPQPIVDAAQSIVVSQRRKKQRVEDHIRVLIQSGSALWCTFTESDECQARTKYETRRQLVRRALKCFTDEYCGNTDYGKDNGREHFHAVAKIPPGLKVRAMPTRVASGKVIYEAYYWIPETQEWRPVACLPCFARIARLMGFISIVVIGKDSPPERVAKYLVKLTRHAVKESTLKDGRCYRVIYSRKV